MVDENDNVAASVSKPKSRRGCGMLLLAALLGLIAGLAAGILLSVGFFWALSDVERELAIDPLADLNLPQKRLTTSELTGVIDRLANDYLQSGDNAGLVIGLVKKSESRTYSFGVLERGKNIQPDENSIFELASVGKTFTAVVLADMHVKGECDLDDPIEEFLPTNVKTPKRDGRSITLVDLATQTSGLPSMPDNFQPGDPLNPYKDYTVEQMYAALGQTQLSAPIGSRYEYSNLGFGLLGNLLERKAGVPYERLVVDRLCSPLGMESTRMTLSPSLKARLATPHDGGKPVVVWEDTTMAGAGSFLSSCSDMLKYVRAHFDDSHPLHEALMLAVKKRRPTDSPETAIGLGWHVTSENALDIVWHNGGAGGSSSYVALLPEQEVGVVVLSNSSSSVDDLGRKLIYLVHRHWEPAGDPERNASAKRR